MLKIFVTFLPGTSGTQPACRRFWLGSMCHQQ